MESKQVEEGGWTHVVSAARPVDQATCCRAHSSKGETKVAARVQRLRRNNRHTGEGLKRDAGSQLSAQRNGWRCSGASGVQSSLVKGQRAGGTADVCEVERRGQHSAGAVAIRGDGLAETYV